MTGTIFTSAKKRTTLKKFFAGFMMLSLNLSLGGVASVLTSNVAYAAPVTIFNDSFESGFNIPTTWTSADDDWSVTSGSGHNGSKKAQVSNQGSSDDNLVKNISTAGFSNISVSYFYKAGQALESTDHVYVEWWNGSSWQQANDLTNISGGSWVGATHNLPSSANNLSSFKLRFRAVGLSDHDELQLDDVTVSGDQTQTLTVTKSGSGSGTVTSSPSGISCGSTCAAAYTTGTVVSLTATPASGSTFTGWSGACTGTGACSVTMSAAQSVTATFTLNTYTLTVAKAGTGAGTVTSSPAGINCGATCSSSYNHGTLVTLTATPSIGSTFTGWSGAGCSGTGACNVTMTAANTVTATFAINSYNLTVNTVGSGSVSSSPAGINCGATCSASYVYNTPITLTASAASGSTFTGWSGAGCSGTGTCTVTMDAAKSVTATFTLDAPAPQTYSLTITKDGPGSGVVTTDPCNCSLTFDSGTLVTLTATPDTGSVFAGWLGDCLGVDTACSVTMNAAKSVTATFNLTPTESCPTGQVPGENGCVCVVGDLVGNECVVVPPPTDCPVGQHLDQTNTCVNNEQPPVECAAGTHLSGDTCVADETPVTPPTGGGGSSSFDYWGCTNPAATNFNSLANKDDGSCKLPGGNGGNGGSTTSPAGEVLGAATTTGELPLPASCAASPYLRDYLKLGKKNDPDQVKLLQSFLNDKAGANLPVNGFFGPLTKTAVKKFQKAHNTEILQPWIDAGFGTGGLKDGTGYVYKTTKRFINIMMCDALNTQPMPDLTPDAGN